MSSHEVAPRNRAERRLAAKTGNKARTAGAVLTAGSAALAMSGAWIGTGVHAAGAATTLHVTSTANAGAGSLRDQIAAANPGDTIDFQVSGTITLTSGEIAFNKALTITGPGASTLTISGNDASRIFDINGAAVTISGLTLAHGSSASSGAAVASSGALTVSDDVFDHNASGDDGGAIDATAALSVTNSTFTNNTTDDWGGAILADGASAPVDITGSTFSGNTAGDTGGAIAVQDEGATTISGSTFSGNTASHAGAVGVFYNGTTSISGSTFSGNTANGSSNQRPGIGGAIDVYSSAAVSISSSTVSGNTASAEGGGISLYQIDGAATIDGTTVSGNSSQSGGGGAYIGYVHAGLTVSNSAITDNTSASWGGGLYLTNTYQFVNVTNTTISGNSAASGGGGVQLAGDGIEGTTVSVTDATISGNTASDGGGGGWIQWDINGLTTFANTTISGNTTSAQGGGLYFYGFSGLNVDMSTVTANTASDSTGGIFFEPAREIKSADGAGRHARPAKPTGSGGTGADGNGTRKPHTAASPVHSAATVADADITGSIVWGNSGNDLGEEANVTLSHDLLGTVASGIVQTDAGGNLFGVDPELGPLQNNGGATETHALLPGSPAIDAGPDPVPDFPGNEFDQRGAGYARVVGTHSDIGAFEVQPPAPEAIVITPKFTG